MLQWARANGAGWNDGTTYQAAVGGHLGLLQWAWAQGCPLNSLAFVGVIRNGYLHTLQ